MSDFNADDMLSAAEIKTVRDDIDGFQDEIRNIDEQIARLQFERSECSRVITKLRARIDAHDDAIGEQQQQRYENALADGHNRD